MGLLKRLKVRIRVLGLCQAVLGHPACICGHCDFPVAACSPHIAASIPGEEHT